MLGKPVTDFSLPSTGGTSFRLSAQRGSRPVLYFNSRNKNFKEALQFPFELLSDRDPAVCKQPVSRSCPGGIELC